jgi:hypothetical protein
LSQDLENLLFIPNQIPDWIENNKEKFNKLVYKSLKAQNRLYEVAMQKMLFGSLSKDLQDEIKKQVTSAATAKKEEAVKQESGQNPSTALFVDGMVPGWVEKYRAEFSSMVYKSLKSQGKLVESSMQKMLYGSLPQQTQEKIKEEIESAKKSPSAQAASPAVSSASVSSGTAISSSQLEPLLQKISSQLDEIIQLLKNR